MRILHFHPSNKYSSRSWETRETKWELVPLRTYILYIYTYPLFRNFVGGRNGTTRALTLLSIKTNRQRYIYIYTCVCVYVCVHNNFESTCPHRCGLLFSGIDRSIHESNGSTQWFVSSLFLFFIFLLLLYPSNKSSDHNTPRVIEITRSITCSVYIP